MQHSNSLFQTPFAELDLHRIPSDGSQANSLRAWDAADELMLNHLAQQQLPEVSSKLLIINDGFGALSGSLSDYSVTNWNDSLISHLACKANLKRNQRTAPIDFLPSTAKPSGLFDLVLIKIPKTLALLEHQLITLKPHINDHTVIIAGGMVKYLQTSHQQLFEKYLGSSTTSLARKKARLIFSTTERRQQASQSPYPLNNYYSQIDLHISQHANVFSKNKLDIGTGFMLQQFNQLPDGNRIVDLGCGNGILGIMAKRQQPKCQLYFIDESYMAVESARNNYFNQNNLQSQQAEDKDNFLVSNCLEQTTLADIDLILCNPPFHHSNTVDDHIAWQMFKQSYKALKQGGRLWVVGNRHLGYHVKLKRLFGHCKTVASHHKFVVLEAQKKLA